MVRRGVLGRSVMWRWVVACVALLAAYFAVPVQVREGGLEVTVRVVVTLVALAALVLAIRRAMLRQLRQPAAPLGGLVAGIVTGVLLFALADYAVAFYAPAEFAGLDTRLDALYFTLSTLLTVGFGDITAHGQFARGLLCVQMLFNVAVLATAGSVLARQVAVRARSRQS